ncbi:5485_t:CDS:2, partial [Gigaspora margarita]
PCSPIEMITDTRVLQRQIVEFIASSKQQNGQEYKAHSLKIAFDSINHLQEKGLSEIQGAHALSLEEVRYILQHESMTILTPENLIYRIFFQMAIIFACRGGEHYYIKADQLKQREDGIYGGNAPIPPGTQGPCYDFQLFLSNRLADANKNLFLQVNPKCRETGIWHKKTHYGVNRLNKFMKEIGQSTKITIPENLLSNHSGRKTATQILHDNEIPEQTIMDITGHLSLYNSNLSNSSQEIQSINLSQEIQPINLSQEIQPINMSQENRSINLSQEMQSINSSQEIQPIKPLQEISTNLSRKVNSINIDQSNSIQIFDNLQRVKENQNGIPSFNN